LSFSFPGTPYRRVLSQKSPGFKQNLTEIDELNEQLTKLTDHIIHTQLNKQTTLQTIYKNKGMNLTIFLAIQVPFKSTVIYCNNVTTETWPTQVDRLFIRLLLLLSEVDVAAIQQYVEFNW